MISILIFILVIAFLIFIHELGHFLAAKLFNIRVDEFAIGFPPTLASFKKGETAYKLNSIPFGGYVKIHGQDGESAADARSFSHSAWWKKIIVLSAGVLFNLIGAWLLFTLMFAIPHMQSIEPHRIDTFANTETVVVLLQEMDPHLILEWKSATVLYR